MKTKTPDNQPDNKKTPKTSKAPKDLKAPKTSKSSKSSKSCQGITPEYLFESFLPYREALNLGRALYGICKLKKIILLGRNVEEQIIERISFNIRYLLPDIKPANITNEEFEKILKRERDDKTLSEDDLQERLENEGNELRAKIDSGELDIWDDSPNFIEFQKCSDYLDNALQALKSKIIDHLAPEKSFFEKMVKEGYGILCKTNDKTNLSNPDITKLQVLLRIWDYAKIAYEKEPPYKIVFSEQVAEFLGIDPVMESIKFQELRGLTKREKKDLKRLSSILWGKNTPTVSTSEASGSLTGIPWASNQEICAIQKVAQRKNAKENP